MCFGQLFGIPVDSDPATFMANLILYYYEKKWFLFTKNGTCEKEKHSHVALG